MAQASTVSSYGPSQSVSKREGKTTTQIERQTSRLPSLTFLGLALGSMAVSAGIALSARPRSRFGSTRRLEVANFIGQWAPTLLIIGLYNKIVKVEEELLSSR